MATATLTRLGNSVAIVIPKELRGDRFRQGDKVSIEEQGDSLVIKPLDAPPTWRSLMSGYVGPKPEFIDPGEAMGREVW